MKVVAIIQARLASKRLPGKALMDIAGRPMIDHVIERAQAIHGVDQVVLCVPERDASSFLDVRERFPHDNSYSIIAIPDQEKNVLGSYLACAVMEGADVIVRITGDCPLLAPDLSSEVLRMFMDQQPDYYANIQPYTTWADGWDTEVFTIAALRLASKMATSAYARQHVTVMIRQLCACLYGPKAPENWTKAKMSVDTDEDLEYVRRIFTKLQPNELGWKYTDTALIDCAPPFTFCRYA